MGQYQELQARTRSYGVRTRGYGAVPGAVGSIRGRTYRNEVEAIRFHPVPLETAGGSRYRLAAVE